VAVSQLGLCSGDLVFLLSDAHEGYAAVAPPAPRPTLVHSAAPPNRPSEIATASPAAMAASAAERRAAASGSSGAAAPAPAPAPALASASASATSDALLSASLARLAEMGFEPAAARAALERGGSLERAVEILSAPAAASASATPAAPAAATAAAPASAALGVLVVGGGVR